MPIRTRGTAELKSHGEAGSQSGRIFQDMIGLRHTCGVNEITLASAIPYNHDAGMALVPRVLRTTAQMLRQSQSLEAGVN